MAEQALTDVAVFFGEYDISTRHNEVTLNYGAEMLDNTKFGDTSRSRHPGMLDFSASGKGFWQGGDGDVDDVLFDNLSVSGKLLTIGPNGADSGEKIFTYQGVTGEYGVAGSVGGLLGFTWAAHGRGGILVPATCLASGTKTSTADGTAYELGALAASQKAYAFMHVLAVSGTSPTLDMIIESDDGSGFASGATRFTFAQASAAGTQWLTPIDGDTGPITDTWWRASWTIGGSDTPTFTVCVGLAIVDDL